MRLAVLRSPPLSGASLFLLRYLGIYLIYLATLVRAVRLLTGNPWQGVALTLLVAYGALLVLEPLITARRGWRSLAYLVLQSALAVALQAIPPRLEILSILFVPLSLQAVRLLGLRTGALWIGAYTLAIIGPVTGEFGRTPTAAIMVLFYCSTFVLMGYYAAMITRTEAARAENERLIDELQLAQARLQAHAAQADQMAAAEERRRMAREMHDSVTQTIFSMNMAVQVARVLLAQQPERVPEQLDRLQQLAQTATAEIRVLARQSGPSSLPRRGLVPSLRQLADEGAARHGLAIRIEAQGTRELPADVRSALCRIVQEALNNVAKHSGAGEAVVRLDLTGARAFLEVEDHGVGFDPAALPLAGEHVGLAGMAERAREIGWQLDLQAQPGRGTRIRIEEV